MEHNRISQSLGVQSSIHGFTHPSWNEVLSPYTILQNDRQNTKHVEPANLSSFEKQTTEVCLTSEQQRSLYYSGDTISELQTFIKSMRSYLFYTEFAICAEEQRYAYRIIDKLNEKGLYRHQAKKLANKLKETTDSLQTRTRNDDKGTTLRKCNQISPRGNYVQDFYMDGGGIAARLQNAFRKSYYLKIKLIRMDCREILKKIDSQHVELLADLYTLLSLTQVAIDLFDFMHQQILSAARGRLKSRIIKSPHHETLQNITSSLINLFIKPGTILPEEESARARKHVEDWEYELTSDETFQLYNGQELAMRMDFVEYYLARVRMDMAGDTVPLSVIREIWQRLGNKDGVRKFFVELSRIKLPKDDDWDAMDMSKIVATSPGAQVSMNAFRRLCIEDNCVEPPQEPSEIKEGRLLRRIARRHGKLDKEDLGILMKEYKTKKGLIAALERAGFELNATIKEVKSMKVDQLKKLIKQ